MHLDVAAAEYRAVVGIIGLAHLVVVDQTVRSILVPDLDAECIRAAVGSGQHETIVAAAIDRTHAFIFGLVLSGNHQPVVARRVEVQICSPELELGVAIRQICALLVLGDEAEGGFASQVWIGDKSPCILI